MGEKGNRKDNLTRTLRDSIQASLDHAEAEHQREMFRRRLDLARAGLQSYSNRKIGDAVRAFLTYLHILEQWKKVPEGKLVPTLFDLKVDAPELLLISGIYWDLAKLFDRSPGEQNQRDFHHFLSQFMLFSKGMTYQTLSSETMRKYLRNEKPVNRKDFIKAYRALSNSRCFVATGLVDVTRDATLPRLRSFRDDVLEKQRGGRVFIRWYEVHGPGLSERMDSCPRFLRRLAGRAVDAIAWLGAGLVAWRSRRR